jgi:hypothetical protein
MFWPPIRTDAFPANDVPGGKCECLLGCSGMRKVAAGLSGLPVGPLRRLLTARNAGCLMGQNGAGAPISRQSVSQSAPLRVA